MNVLRRSRVAGASLLAAALAFGGPALAQHGGGGHSGGGGGHAGGGAHASMGHAGGAGNYAAGAHYSSGAHYSAGAHYAVGAHYGGGYAPGGHSYGGGAYGGHAAYGYPGGGYRHGYSTGTYWQGGYWRGGYWPRAYYGLGFAWFLPVLPLAYATYWYGAVPYYYANDVYYTWNPDYEGYVATDPPPVADQAGAAGAEGSASPPTGGPAQGLSGTISPNAAVGAQIFMYPKNGQSEAQQSVDKRECQQWASSQAGQGAANAGDYRRAMLACIEGRGYSAN